MRNARYLIIFILFLLIASNFFNIFDEDMFNSNLTESNKENDDSIHPDVSEESKLYTKSRAFQNRAHGGSWADSFNDDSNIDWGMSDHLLLRSGDVLINITNGTYVDPNIVGLWHFDEGSGIIVYDSSFYGNDGVLGRDGLGTDLPTWTTGKYGTGLSFDGINDIVNGTWIQSFSDEVTLEAWFKSPGGGMGWPRLIEFSDSTGSNLYSTSLSYDLDGSLRGWVTSESGVRGGTCDTTTQMWKDNNWHHAVYTYDGNSGIIYVDGTEIVSATNNPTSDIHDGSTWIIGSYLPMSTDYFKGIIDEVAILNRTLTAQEIKDHYDYGIGVGLRFRTANITSKPILLPNDMNWDTLVINKSQYDKTFLNVTILDATNNQPIPGSPTYIDNGEFDISYIDPINYPTIKLNATFVGNVQFSSRLHYWGVSWNASHTWCDTLFGGKKIGSNHNVEILEGMVQFQNASYFISTSINVSSNHYYKTLIINKLEPFSGYLNVTILNGSTNTLIPGFVDLTDTVIDLSGLDQFYYPAIKLKATYSSGGQLGTLYDWSVKMVRPPVQIRPLQDNNKAVEDQEFYSQYWNFGYNSVSEWTLESNGSWVAWDPINNSIYGTPNNGDVGSCWVRLNITDDLGNFDEHNFTIEVENTPPDIITENLLFAIEGKYYYIDYNSSDDGQGNINWYLETNITWLSIDQATGELSGFATNEIFPSYLVKVTVNDGNGGTDYAALLLRIFYNPIIITENVTTTYEDEHYSVDYNATDIDGDTVFEWYLETNANWLSIEKDSGILTGTPQNDDVGFSFVNVTVRDSRDGNSSQNFTLEVLNTNDPPEWEVEPKTTTVNEGEVYTFDVNATDMDIGDVLTYIISSDPITDITIDPESGLIQWTAFTDGLGDAKILRVTVTATDGEDYIFSNFDITVITNQPPTTSLITPIKNSLVSASGVELKWEGHDNEHNELVYDVYVSKDLPSITNLLTSARVIQKTNKTSYYISNLIIGDIYYWSVIPYDGFSYGSCTDGMFIFLVNTPPTFSSIPIQKATVGKKYEYQLKVNELNIEDTMKLVFSLDSPPDGMSIDSSSGVITWTPTKDQVGKHAIMVNVSDGKDITSTRFDIDVKKSDADKKASSANQILIIGVIIIIIVIILLFIAVMISKKRRKLLIPDAEYIPPKDTKDMLAAGTTKKPGAISPSSVIIDQVPTPEKQTQIQPTAAAGPGKTPVVTPTILQTPQLPPAKIEAEAPEAKPETTTPVPAVVPIPGSTPAATTSPTPTPIHITIPTSETPLAVEEQVATDFGLEGGPKPVQKEAVEHEVVTERVVEEPDIGADTADLQAASVVEPAEGGAIVHDEETTIWRPEEKGKVEENKEVLEQLKTLAELKDKGALTEEEFEQKKKELLG